MTSVDPLAPDSAMLDGVRAYLHIEDANDDGSLDTILLAAINHAETFCGQMLLQRIMRQLLPVSSTWQDLSAFPIISLQTVTGIPAEGAGFALADSAFQFERGFDGTGRIRILQPGSAGRVEVAAIAGLASGWYAIPEAIRLGILRMTGHFYAQRDGEGGGAVPDSALALLRPWRRIRLK